ncbi:MAG TPA: response regulator [Hyphomonadaceae bacterium]|nr:response regulator [Hyphomonadaceae bacterium]
MADANDPLVYETIETPAPVARKGFDFIQLGFWAALAVAGGAAGMALTWSDAVGPAGAVLVIALGAMALVLVLWVMRGAGRKLGMFPERGAAEAAVQSTKRHIWLEALQEPALISDRGGATVAANEAYLGVAQLAHIAGDSAHAPSVDRLFSSNPGMAAPIYRLSKAVKLGVAKTEILPALLFGDSHMPVQFEASVSPLGKTRALWRLRRVEAGSQIAGSGSVDPRALYVEDAPVGFFSARRDGRVVYINQTLRQMLGLPDGDNALRLEDIMRPEGLKLMKREVRGATSQRAEVVLRARDGVETTATMITTWAGKGAEALTRSIVYVASAAEQAVRRAPAPATTNVADNKGGVRVDDTMFTDAPFGVVRLDGEGVESAVMMDANRTLVEMTDGRAQPGARFADLFVADHGAAALAEELGKALDGARNFKLAGQKDRSADVFVTLDRQGRPSAAYVIDTTERTHLEQRAAQGAKLQAIGQLAGELAHDFNNLLTVIILNVDRLLVRHPPGDPSFFELRSINEASSRGAELVRTLLAYSRKQVFRPEVLDISDALADYYVLLRDIIDERIKLDIVHGRDLPRVKVDKGQIETAVTNLCTNARDAMIEKNGGGRLTIRTSRADAAAARKDGFTLVTEGDYVMIEVVDDGAGIPPEIMEKIFQPFYTTKDPGKGTGLGLATVYGIVKQSNGYIYPVSKVGRGTTFKIFLPAWTEEASAATEALSEAPTALPPVQAPAQPAKSGDLAGRGSILLVEDEDGVRGIAAQLLAACGYQVIEASDGEKALEIIKEHSGSIDLLISDVVMPGMDGPALLKEARPWLTKTRVMFISGYAERDLAKTLEDDRAISFLPKPFTLKQLAERVKQELAAAA